MEAARTAITFSQDGQLVGVAVVDLTTGLTRRSWHFDGPGSPHLVLDRSQRHAAIFDRTSAYWWQVGLPDGLLAAANSTGDEPISRDVGADDRVRVGSLVSGPTDGWLLGQRRGAESAVQLIGLDGKAKTLWQMEGEIGQASCSVCHDPHGIASGLGTADGNTHLINFDLRVVEPNSNGELRFEDRGRQAGSCYLLCHGSDHNPKTY